MGQPGAPAGMFWASPGVRSRGSFWTGMRVGFGSGARGTWQAAGDEPPPQGGCATFLCQPLDVLKTRLMNSKGEYQVSGACAVRLCSPASPLTSPGRGHSHWEPGEGYPSLLVAYLCTAVGLRRGVVPLSAFALFLFLKISWPSTVAHACNPTLWEPEAGRPLESRSSRPAWAIY